MARRLLRRQPGSGRGVGQDQELSRLWHLSTASDCQRDCIERPAGLCQRNRPPLSETAGRLGGWIKPDWLAGHEAFGDDVCVGAHSAPASSYGLVGILEAVVEGSEGGRVARYR